MIAANLRTPAYASGADEVTVSPGTYDLQLGDDFPGLGSVKLSHPNSTILTDSVGDLLFTVTLKPSPSNRTIDTVTNASYYTAIDIYIPPDFTGISTEKVWTSYTNDYDPNSLSVSRVSSTDQIGPNWWRISVKRLIVTSNLTLARTNRTLTAHRVFVANQSQYIRLFQVSSPTTAGRYFFKVFLNGTSVGASKFPTIVVAASRNPAYISGTLRDAGDLDPTLAGDPIELPNGFGARVVATGIDYLGRSVSAQAFINSTAEGRYTLFGVAPGTYNLTAYAAGFRPTISPLRVNVLPAQSLEGVDIFLPHSANVTGTVHSATGDGAPLQWGSLFGFGGTELSRSIVIRVLTLDGGVVASTPAPYRPSLFTDPESTTFQFSILREAGFDGRIPQDYANYTSGLTAGDYTLRAYVTSYVQFDEVRVHVTNETKTTYSEITLVRSGFISVTVHFKDLDSNLEPTPTSVDGTLTIQVYDQQGNQKGSNSTNVPAGSTEATVEIHGFSEARSFGITGLLPANSGLLPGTYEVYARFTSSPTFTGYANVGVRELYYQMELQRVTVGLSSSVSVNVPARVSFPMLRGGGVILTLYSVDVERPGVLKPWTFPGSVVRLKLIDSLGNVYDANATQLTGRTAIKFYYSGLRTNQYEIVVRTVGYSQLDITHVHIVMGGNTDALVWLRQDPILEVRLVFRSEGLLSVIDSTLPYVQPLNHLDSTPARVELFDLLGNFAAANITYITNFTDDTATTTFRVVLAGFDRYFGNPKKIWSGFYDSTDATRQDEAGIPPGTYILLIWVNGYYQREQVLVTLGQRANASVVVSVDRASRISGLIAGPDWYSEGRPVSWVTVDLEPGNYTTFSLDGYYQIWVPGGSYEVGFYAAGYSRETMRLIVPWSSDIQLPIWLNFG